MPIAAFFQPAIKLTFPLHELLSCVPATENHKAVWVLPTDISFSSYPQVIILFLLSFPSCLHFPLGISSDLYNSSQNYKLPLIPSTFKK